MKPLLFAAIYSLMIFSFQTGLSQQIPSKRPGVDKPVNKQVNNPEMASDIILNAVNGTGDGSLRKEVLNKDKGRWTLTGGKLLGSREIRWQGVREIRYSEEIVERFLFFEGASYDPATGHLPTYYEKIKLNQEINKIAVQITNLVFEEFNGNENSIITLNKKINISTDIVVNATVTYQRKKPYAVISFMPIRKNEFTGKYEKLVSFDMEVKTFAGEDTHLTPFKKGEQMYASSSVLSSGSWYGIGVTQDGIYELSSPFLSSLGMNVSSINPKNIRIYSNGGGMLPLSNSAPRIDDLAENAIQVVGESDGSFDADDYVLFFGQGPARWSYDTTDNRFHHQLHLYSDTTYYFITADLGPGKRIITQPSDSGVSTSVTSFDDHAFHEKDLVNLIKSGRQWYGEEFDMVTSYNFTFSFPNISSSPVYMKASVIARSTEASSIFSVNANSQSLLSLTCSSVTEDFTTAYADPESGTGTFNPSSTVTVTVSYNKPASSSIGWLNYLELNARRQLKMYGNQMTFRDIQSVGTGNVAGFTLSNASSSIKVWEVTDPTNVKEQQYTLSGANLEFTLQTDSLREFIAFNGNSYLTPTASGSVPNQDLHGLSQPGQKQPEMIIVSHPAFLSEADRLADFHRVEDGLSVVIVTPQQVYNEFSSGSQDISAIKYFMKMFYDRAGSDSSYLPKYLLLFGDGSYDNKNRLSDNTNFIPTYQSSNSYSPTSSYVSDDFYGLLDDNESEATTDEVDIGIGRLPVKTVSEASAAIDKIIHYTNPAAMGDWRNIVCFVADDEDTNTHIKDADLLANYVDNNYNDFNIDKIYIDAYQQQSTPGGQRYPDAAEAINKRVEKGALIINYTGHGGETGWAHERILEVNDINNWNNLDNMPLFMTATCEFSRFDDPGRTSAGEYVFLNSNGGGIALLSTVRLVFSGANQTLADNFYKIVFEPVNGEMPRLGDVVMNTKNNCNIIDSSSNRRKYLLLGDPALRLAYPVHNIITDSINGNPVSMGPDTMKALAKVTVSGHLENENGVTLSGFNGTLYPTVYDKAAVISTLVNDPNSGHKDFTLQKNVLFRGKVSVINGGFSFAFIVPKDINYNDDFGRISYYAENGITDANGYYEDFIIGGSATNVENDETGPEVDLYLNDTNFVFGGLTDENPILLAFIYDRNGINTTGTGIGHDIVAILDNETNQSIVLNDEYESDLDSYQRGTIRSPLKDLSEGRHILELTVWDTYNNSARAYTEFVVAMSAELALDHVFNYPNPFTTYTEFWFEHNRPGELLDVQIQVFTVSGKLIKTINTNVLSDGFRPDPIQWNGMDDYGDKIGRGVYIYHLKVRSDDGSFKDKYEKLVILN
ncbi:MAG: type IX secretion system sortase PorU [Bacteroidota bacterium]